jgi:peptidoglycan L-alanyl-D-glutamate endopeptidase CwlK
MPKFSQSSFSKLSSCHIDLQVLFYEVIKNFDCTILEGYRNEKDQEEAFEKGNTKVHYPHGKHNRTPSLAVDVIPYPVDWKDSKLHLWFGGYVLGIAQMLKDQGKMTHSLRWGGSWDGLGKLDKPGQLNDPVHFELME